MLEGGRDPRLWRLGLAWTSQKEKAREGDPKKAREGDPSAEKWKSG